MSTPLLLKRLSSGAAWLLAIALLVAPSSSRAEASAAEKAAAEALFDHGLALLREGRVKEACVRLEQSQAIERAIGTLLYLAECYEHLGRSASAWALFREAGSAARSARQEERMHIADERAKRLESDLAKLTLETEPGAAQRSLEVQVDEVKQPVGLWGVSLPVDPGEHRIVVRAPGYQPWSTVLKLAPTEQRTVHIPPLSLEPGSPIAPARPASPPVRTGIATPLAASTPAAPEPIAARSDAPAAARPRRRSLSTRAIALSLGGAGLAAAGVGSYFGVRAMQKNDDAARFCADGGSACTDARGVRLTDDAKRAARMANALVIGGAALAAVGLVVFLVGPRERAPQIALSGSTEGAALSLRGAF